MKLKFLAVFCGMFVPFASFAAREGVPQYYQNGIEDNTPAFSRSQRQVVGQNISYQPVPREQETIIGNIGDGRGQMTPNGIALMQKPRWQVGVEYGRRFADFQFETGVQSVLKWNNMIFDELGVRADHNFSIKSMDLFAFGEYKQGKMRRGGMSMDFDLRPYDNSQPEVGIFTISVGDMTGKTDYMRLGFGAKHIWDIGGWKLSPSIGYEIFKHNLQMHDHMYPNPGIYLPLLNQFGDYIYGDAQGKYYSVPQGTPPPEDLYQVCLSPEDIKVAASDPNTHAPVVVDNGDGTFSLVTQDYDPIWTYLPWGVGPGDCVIIGGDGPVIVGGITHIYNTTWSGFYIGLEVEKQMTFVDKLRFYVQVGKPNYSSDGIWPNRTDWQQNPSFIDAGSNGSFSYQAEIEYSYNISDRLQLSLKANTNFFHVGQISGELFVAAYTSYLMDEFGQFVLDDNGLPILYTVDAHTDFIPDSLKYANWQSFSLHLGVKYAF
jgi:hypothetical protein